MQEIFHGGLPLFAPTQTCAFAACIATPGGPLRVLSLHLAHVAVDAVSLTGTTLHTHEKAITGTRHLRQLDHCLITPDLAPRVLRAWTDPDKGASDHLPLWVDLS